MEEEKTVEMTTSDPLIYRDKNTGRIEFVDGIDIAMLLFVVDGDEVKMMHNIPLIPLKGVAATLIPTLEKMVRGE